ERAARARAELDYVVQELSAAVGLGGRDRRAASDAERARVNVTRAIRSAVKRIADQDPTVGGHLDVSVRTGLFCRYDPDPGSTITWTVRD
ncbi:MAG: transcriptional regulator, partial [Baekduiaceae bacterium]